jgi:hypothetical protein
VTVDGNDFLCDLEGSPLRYMRRLKLGEDPAFVAR